MARIHVTVICTYIVHVHSKCTCVSLQLDAYDLLTKEPSTVLMADNHCRELLGAYMYIYMCNMYNRFTYDS